MNKEIKIKSMVWLYEIFLSCIIIAFLFIMQIVLLNGYYRIYQTNILNNVAKNIKLSDSISENELETLAHENGICISKYSDNDILYTSKFNSGCYIDEKMIQSKFIPSSFSDNDESLTIINDRLNNQILLKTVKKGSNIILLSSSLTPLDSSIKLLKSQYIYIIIIVFLLSLIVGYYISKIISKPILKISKQAKELGKGNYNVDFIESDIKEINELSNTLKQSSLELSKTDELRRDLMANVGHDLKTPLTMIKAYAEMLKDMPNQSEEKKTNNLNIIVNEVDRLTVLVNDIIDLSKLQSYTNKVSFEEVNVDQMIKDIINGYNILILNEKYEFIYNGIDNLKLNTDKKMLYQAIYNLINNAINYTGKDKKVYINVINNKNAYRFEIKDTGNGIKEDIEHIWDKYYHNEKKHKRNEYGTGLGLSIVKNVMEQLNYEYGVSSTKKGTTFYFEIKK